MNQLEMMLKIAQELVASLSWMKDYYERNLQLGSDEITGVRIEDDTLYVSDDYSITWNGKEYEIETFVPSYSCTEGPGGYLVLIDKTASAWKAVEILFQSMAQSELERRLENVANGFEYQTTN